jgi:hypothetical protein
MFFTYLLASLLCATRPVRPPAATTPPYQYVDHLDESESFDMVLGLLGGAGASPRVASVAAEYVGFKLGGGCCVRGKHPFEHGDTVTLDIGWDRLRSRNAASVEMSLMIGVARFPRPAPGESRKFVRVYAEPGGGVRLGDGSFAYYSAKAMVAFMSDAQIARFAGAPIIEVQHRFPFTALSRGDTRIVVGVMAPLCKHCGFD